VSFAAQHSRVFLLKVHYVLCQVRTISLCIVKVHLNLQCRVMAQADQIPVADRSNARICGRSLVGVAGSNPAEVMDVCVVCVVR
jgi:hypothetical protein